MFALPVIDAAAWLGESTEKCSRLHMNNRISPSLTLKFTFAGLLLVDTPDDDDDDG
jgi:hypothetical protein